MQKHVWLAINEKFETQSGYVRHSLLHSLQNDILWSYPHCNNKSHTEHLANTKIIYFYYKITFPFIKNYFFGILLLHDFDVVLFVAVAIQLCRRERSGQLSAGAVSQETGLCPTASRAGRAAAPGS